MSNFTRRTIIHAGLAATGALIAPNFALGQSGNKVIRAALGDVTIYDPVVSNDNATWSHAAMVYDMLFGLDSQSRAQPQMIGKYELSHDKLTWTFELREGLKFHDGTEVTSADVVASIRRWAAGPHGPGAPWTERVTDIATKDSKTFTIQLKERLGLIPELMARNLYIMRKQEADTDPRVKITTVVGSGPFRFNMADTRPGVQVVYDRNPDYVPRKEQPSGMAGGKVVKVDRVIFMNIKDPQTAVYAVQAGEIDFCPSPPVDQLEQLSQDKNLRIKVVNESGNIGYIRINCLQPPFDNVKCRQALLYIVNQVDYLKAVFGNTNYSRPCASFFGCGTALENDANTDWFKSAPDYARAKQLLKEGGYDGRAVVLMQGTDWYVSKTSAEVLASEMRRAGINVQMAVIDWAGLMARRASKAPPEQGGWNMYVTTGAIPDAAGVLLPFLAANGEKGFFGWPSDATHEELRAKWVQTESLEERKKLAREMQENIWKFVPMVQFGMWTQPALMRANLKGVLSTPYFWWNVFWNAEKT